MAVRVFELKRAIQRNEITPHFQPIVDIRNHTLVGFEVLARWNHPIYGPIPPTEFIEKAERFGLIDGLTDSVLSQAARAAGRWPKHLRLSMNLSPLQLKQGDLPERLRRTVEAESISIDRITVEITETALLGDISMAKEVARSLKEMGCLLAIDDFGTGYSSLKHLRSLPFDVLKVDASFVRSMTSRREDRKIVAAVVGLGHSLGLTVVAEGIEQQEHADTLLCLGCYTGQGWLFGKALPAEEAAELTLSDCPFGLRQRRAIAEAALQLQAHPVNRLAQLQALYEGAPVGLCFLDIQLRYVSLNQRLAEINNAPIEAHIGRTVAEVIPDVSPDIYPRLQNALAGNGTSFEIEMGERLLFAHYQPARDESEDIVGISVAIIDITSLRHSVKALANAD